MPRFCSSLLLSVLIASAASAVTMDWTPIGTAGNACDPQSQGCFGSVGYAYNIGTYEVTNAQYTEFLNAKAGSDPNFLYDEYMGDPSLGYPQGHGGITRSGSSGNYTYSVIAGRGDMPVNYVSIFNAMRFANWMSNGQGNGDTETGSYTLLGGGFNPSNADTVTRNAGATIVLPTEDEWYKAAYYDSSTASYFDYPGAGGVICSTPAGSPDRANCDGAVGDFTPKGSYPGSPSRYGSFDQGGNAWEWNETILDSQYRGTRGGSFFEGYSSLAASTRIVSGSQNRQPDLGFRVAMIPEPGTGLLMIGGIFGLVGLRRARD